MSNSLCELSQRFSRLAYRSLTARHRSDGAMRLGETAVTSLIAWSSIEFARGLPLLVTEHTNEAVTGADLEIHFVGSSGHYCWLVQAKRLTFDNALSKRKRTPPKYKDLNHKVKGTGDYQIESLCKTAKHRQAVPVYFLYGFDTSDPQDGSCPNRECGYICHPTADPDEGIRVATAEALFGRIQAGTTLAATKSFAELQTISKPLSDLWCGYNSTDIAQIGHHAIGQLTGPNVPIPDVNPEVPAAIRSLLAGERHSGDSFDARHVLVWASEGSI